MVEHDIAYELGWDHARHTVELPSEALSASHRLRLGYETGRHMFGPRARSATPAARLWLGLRLQALLRGRRFEPLSVTPNYLQQLQATHCPITRQALTRSDNDACGLSAGGAPSDARIVRLRDDAAYAAGHLVTVSRTAEAALQACADLDPSDICAEVTGLSPAATERLAALVACVTPLPQQQAAQIPLCVLPPNRLRLLNPVQALQAVVTRLRLPHAQRDTRWTDLLAMWDHLGADRPVWLERLRQLTAAEATPPTADDPTVRWAIEDAWADDELRACWTEWASQAPPLQIDTLLAAIAEHGKTGPRLLILPAEQCTDGWSLDTRGFAPPSPSAQIHPFPPRGPRHPTPPRPHQRAA